MFSFFLFFSFGPKLSPCFNSLPLCRCCCHIHHTASALPVCAWLAHSRRHSCSSCFILIIKLGYRCFLVFYFFFLTFCFKELFPATFYPSIPFHRVLPLLCFYCIHPHPPTWIANVLSTITHRSRRNFRPRDSILFFLLFKRMSHFCLTAWLSSVCSVYNLLCLLPFLCPSRFSGPHHTAPKPKLYTIPVARLFWLTAESACVCVVIFAPLWKPTTSRVVPAITVFDQVPVLQRAVKLPHARRAQPLQSTAIIGPRLSRRRSNQWIPKMMTKKRCWKVSSTAMTMKGSRLALKTPHRHMHQLSPKNFRRRSLAMWLSTADPNSSRQIHFRPIRSALATCFLRRVGFLFDMMIRRLMGIWTCGWIQWFHTGLGSSKISPYFIFACTTCSRGSFLSVATVGIQVARSVTPKERGLHHLASTSDWLVRGVLLWQVCDQTMGLQRGDAGTRDRNLWTMHQSSRLMKSLTKTMKIVNRCHSSTRRWWNSPTMLTWRWKEEYQSIMNSSTGQPSTNGDDNVERRAICAIWCRITWSTCKHPRQSPTWFPISWPPWKRLKRRTKAAGSHRHLYGSVNRRNMRGWQMLRSK